MVNFGELTIITTIDPASLSSLQDLLNSIGNDIPNNRTIRFSDLTTVHFMRWVILDASVDIHGKVIPASLAFGVDFDGNANVFLQSLVASQQDGLDEIYQHCVGFPGANQPTKLAAYLTNNNIKASGYYAGYRGRSLEQVNDEAMLRQSVQTYLNTNYSQPQGKDPQQVLQGVKQYVTAGNPSNSQLVNTPYMPYVGKGLAEPIAIIASLLVLYGALLYLAPVSWLAKLLFTLCLIGIPASILLIKEATDQSWTGVPDPKSVSMLLANEDRRLLAQNQLTHLVNIKPGWFRISVLRFVLSAINLLAASVFFKGELGGIPSIHFARWVIIDKGRRLLFFSNFDGSWENYLGDFIDRAHQGLTGVWTNTEGFPKTHFLIGDGATNEELFKNWTRLHQIPTQVWYSASPLLTVQNINNNTSIRTGLTSNSTLDPKEWVKLI